MKTIKLSFHAKDQAKFRGVTEQEIQETIETSQWKPAELDRLECRKNFPFEKQWNDTYYETKQVRPIFVEEEKEIVVITVYTYYF